MAEKTPNPPVALHDDHDLWLVSYSDDDDREMSALQISAALARGDIDANTIVWRDGMPEWKAIAEVDVLKEQLRQVSASPENQRKRQTVIGGFGPAQPFTSVAPGGPTPAGQLPLAAPPPGFDDDEPTVVQPAATLGFGSSPNSVTPGPTSSRSRHPTSGNTLRIRTGGEPVTMRTPTPPTQATTVNDEVPEPELESIPSALLVTATNNTEVEEAVNAVKRNSTTPPLPTRGVMSRSSDPPHNRVSANLPRAALTRDGDSDAPTPMLRVTDAPKPPIPKRSDVDGVDSLAPEDVKSETDSNAPTDNGPETPRYKTPVASVQLRDDVEQVFSPDLQKTRPPRARREPLIESGTPPPLGELSEVASRIARGAQSHAPLPEPQPKSSTARLVGWLLFGAAAVAGAFTLGKRSSDPSEAVRASTPVTSIPAVPANNPVSTGPDALSNAKDDGAAGGSVGSNGEAAGTIGDNTYGSLATKPTLATAAARANTPSTARTTTIKSVAATSATVVAPAQSSANVAANSTPTETAAAGAPGPFDSSAAANALALAANKASSCRQPGDPSGIARVTVTFTNSGKSTHALVDGPPFAGTATGGCIAATMRSTTVPAFIGERVTVKKTVVIQ
jgi:hypothetical protein